MAPQINDHTLEQTRTQQPPAHRSQRRQSLPGRLFPGAICTPSSAVLGCGRATEREQSSHSRPQEPKTKARKGEEAAGLTWVRQGGEAAQGLGLGAQGAVRRPSPWKARGTFRKEDLRVTPKACPTAAHQGEAQPEA